MQSFKSFFLQNSFLRSYFDSGLANKIDSVKQGIANGLATLGPDGILTLSQRPASSGSSGPGAIIWQAGAASPPSGVLTDWLSVYSKIQSTPGIKTVIIDSSINQCVIPAGSYDLTGVIFFGLKIYLDFFGQSSPQLVVDPGVSFTNPPEEIHRLKIEFSPASGTSVFTIAGSISTKFVDSTLLNNGAGHVISVPVGKSLATFLENTYIDIIDAGTGNFFNVLGTLIVVCIAGNCLIGDDHFAGNGTIDGIWYGGWNNNTSGLIWGSTQSFSGSFNLLNIRNTSAISYNNQRGGNQNISANVLQDVIQEINPKKSGRLNTKGSLLSGDGSGNLIGIPAGANGKVPIYDSSQTSGIRTDFYTGQNEFIIGTVTTAQVIDFKNGLSQRVTLGASSVSFSFLNMESGRLYRLFIVQDNTGGRTVGTFTGIRWQNDAVPTFTTAAHYGTLLELYFTGSFLLGFNKGNYNGA